MQQCPEDLHIVRKSRAERSYFEKKAKTTALILTMCWKNKLLSRFQTNKLRSITVFSFSGFVSFPVLWCSALVQEHLLRSVTTERPLDPDSGSLLLTQPIWVCFHLPWNKKGRNKHLYLSPILFRWWTILSGRKLQILIAGRPGWVTLNSRWDKTNHYEKKIEQLRWPFFDFRNAKLGTTWYFASSLFVRWSWRNVCKVLWDICST